MKIRSDRWPRLSLLLDQALELPAEAHQDWLAEQELDADDRMALQRLLAALDGGPDWMDRAGTPAVSGDLEVGSRIGPFVIASVLGRGGMGVVYAAERDGDELQQHTALKLLPASLDSGDRRRRFFEERRLLARLEHPGIARLIDGGVSDDGRPWFAMERVYGQPIDQYCRERNLDLHARLRLLLEVCEAVQYAHGQLIVHRDIKPSNILVDREARVRLLDFGIAKAIDDDEQTGTLWRALTPSYAAPEQIRGEPASVASDVWSLGVLLYVLVTGETPFAVVRAQGGAGAELGAVLETEPSPPARAAGAHSPIPARELRGDIDAIVLRALAKEPARRYGSVDALAADIRRYLAYQPVLARRGAWSYRTRLFLRRYRLPVAITLVAILALAATVLFALSEANRAKDEAARSTLVKDFLIGLFELGDPDAIGAASIDARTLLRLGSERASAAFAGAPALRAELVRSIAGLTAKLGDYDYGVRILDEILAAGTTEADELPVSDLLALRIDRAQLLLRAGEVDRASEELERALQLHKDRAVSDDGERARLLLVQAGIDEVGGRFEQARDAIEQALALDRALEGHIGPAVARDLYALGNLQQAGGELESAQQTLRSLLELERTRLGNRHTRIADIENDLGVIAAMRGDHDEAEAHHRRALDLRRSLLGGEHPLVAQSLRNWGGSERQRGRMDIAEEMYRDALNIFLQTLGASHPETGLTYNALAVASFGRGDMRAARQSLQHARDVFLQQPRTHPTLANLEMNLAGVEARLGNWPAARAGYDTALARLLELYGENHPLIAAAVGGKAALALLDDRPEEALIDLERAEAIHAVIYSEDHLDRWLIAGTKARCLLRLGRVDEAEAIAAMLGDRLSSILPDGHLRRQELELLQADLDLLRGDADGAYSRLQPVLAQRRAAIEQYPYGVSEAALVAASVELALGRRDRARALIEEADAAFSPQQLPLLQAELRTDLLQRAR